MAQIYKPQPRQAKNKPLLAQTVVGLDHQGRGIIRTPQGVRFVANALPGETVDVIVDGKYTATLLKVTKPSAQRLKPPCDYYDSCGGCDFQHVDLAAQVAHKQQTVQEMLSKFASMEAQTWFAPLQADAWHYRRRARLAVHYDRKRQQLTLGFRAAQSKRIVAIDSCLTLAQPLNKLLKPLRDALAKLALAKHLGHVELIEFAQQPAVLLRVATRLEDKDKSQLEAFAQAHNVAVWLAYEHTVEPLMATQALPQYGTIGALLSCQPTDFIQSHRQLSQSMVAQALAWLDIQADETVLELFAGSGHFTIPLAQAGAKVTAIEGVSSMVEQLQQNAKANCVEVDAFCANLEQPWPQQSWGAKVYSKALLDPARAGAAAAVEEIAKRNIARIVYVSCAPDTLARDAATLKAHGYVLKRAQVIDMFPQTHHIEVITLFERE